MGLRLLTLVLEDKGLPPSDASFPSQLFVLLPPLFQTLGPQRNPTDGTKAAPQQRSRRSVCMCARARACVCAYTCVCVRVCARACVLCVRARVYVCVLCVHAHV